jgi:hypothetical protein
MKVLNLQCAGQHSFEGWFGSEADFLSQQTRGLVICPLCGDAQIQKMLSAPRLNLRSTRGEADTARLVEEPVGVSSDLEVKEVAAAAPQSQLMQARLMQAMREILSNTEDVGERFADQARAMHYGDLEQRSIRGQSTPDVVMALIEEGIEVMPLPHVPALKETLQ